jgi:hypothetical protein
MASSGSSGDVPAGTKRGQSGFPHTPLLSVARQQPATSFFLDGTAVSGAGSSSRGVSLGRVKAASPLPLIGEGDLRE